MKSKLIIVGAGGRMGKRITMLAMDEKGFEVIGAIEQKDHPEIGQPAGPHGINLTSDFPSGADVVIDFSAPEQAGATADYCLENNAALVLGTTGLSDNQLEKLKIASEKIPLVYATNMSAGMNVLFSIVGKTASLLGEDYDIEIIEQHHRFKKDAPSGSALTLAKNICRTVNRDYPDCLTYGRCGKDAKRQKGTIGVHAVRAGDITGIHSVMFSTLGETVTLNHSAHNRDGFAKGAIRAALWLIEKTPRSYSMADVLGIT